LKQQQQQQQLTAESRATLQTELEGCKQDLLVRGVLVFC
jgi:hypothetical protein